MVSEDSKELLPDYDAVRRHSLEYTFGSSGNGKQKLGKDGAENDFEAWEAPRNTRRNIQFAIDKEDQKEEEDAAFDIKINHEVQQQQYRKSRGNLKKTDGKAFFQKANDGSSFVTPQQSSRNQRKSATGKNDNMKKTKTSKIIDSGEKSSQKQVRPEQKESSTQQKTKSKPARPRPKSAMPASRRPPTSRASPVGTAATSTVRKPITRQPDGIPGERISPEERLYIKNKHSTRNIRARVRPNVRARIVELDDKIRTRWNVSSKLEYLERLHQGVEAVSRSEKIDWILENDFEDTPEIREAKLIEDSEKRRIERQKYSTACATLSKERPTTAPSKRLKDHRRKTMAMLAAAGIDK